MADFLKVVGVIVFVVAGAAMALLANSGGFVSAITVMPALIGGAVVYGVGEIMINVAAIKHASERQAAAMEEMTRQNTAKPR